MRMNDRQKFQWVAIAFVVPHLAGVMVFYIIPFLWGVFESFATDSGPGLDTYIQLVHNAAFRLAAFNTLILCICTIPLLIVVSLAAALYVNRYTRSGWLGMHAVVVNYAIPTASIAYMWTLLFGNFGFFNKTLQVIFGASATNWLDGYYLYVPVVAFFLIKYAAYPMFIFFGGVQSLPKEIYDAASIDGASPYKKFIYLTVPLLKPEFVFVATLGLFFNFKMYKEAYMMFGAYPPKSIYLLQHFMNNHFQKLNLDLLTASASFTSMVIAVLLLILIRMNRAAYFRL